VHEKFSNGEEMMATNRNKDQNNSVHNLAKKLQIQYMRQHIFSIHLKHNIVLLSTTQLSSFSPDDNFLCMPCKSSSFKVHWWSFSLWFTRAGVESGMPG